MMHGTIDGNGLRTISDTSVDAIGRYIDAGKGVLAGHDTIGFRMGKNVGLSRLSEKFNLMLGVWENITQNGYEINEGWAYSSTKVKSTKRGFLTQFPWNLGPIGTVLNIPVTHTTSNAAKGNVWMELTEGKYWDTGTIKTEEEANARLPKDVNHRYYLTTWNNTAMIQTGHSNGNSTEDERKVLANTLFYLKQLTRKTELLDNSARDIADPNVVSSITFKIDENNSNKIEFARPEDNGSTYEYYVKGVVGDSEITTDTKSAELKTGVKKYKYVVSESETSPSVSDVLANGTEVQSIGERESIDIGNVYSNTTAKYVHIVAIDGAGNNSQVTTKKLELNGQELEITKDTVGDKKEYKIGDRVKYSIKVKIRENENNRGSVSNVSITDAYNSNYLRFVNNQITKVDGSREGIVTATIPSVRYGEVQEITYELEVLENANGKNNVTNSVVGRGNGISGTSVDGNGSKKIVVNDPKIEVQKTIDKLEYKVGDEITYTVRIKSLVPGTTMKDVNIQEIIPNGLDLKEDSAKISINGGEIESGLVKTTEGDITKVSAGLTEINRK